VIGRRQFGYSVGFSPSGFFAQIGVNGSLGQDVDIDNSRPGRGPTINANVILRPTDHLELSVIQNRQRLSVDDPAGQSRRLFTAQVSRMKGTYTFTSRLFARAIGQYVSTDRDPSLYINSISTRSGSFGGSLLLAYRLNWQSVVFVGYGDDRELTDPMVDRGRYLAPLDRQVFVKLSYAFRR
jgi:hypothetical protein